MLGLYFTWLRYDARIALEEAEKSRLLAQSKALHYIVGGQIAEANAILGTQAQEWAEDMNVEAATRRLKALDSALVGMRSMLILDENGISIVSSRSDLVGRNFSERAYYKYFKDNPSRGKLFVSPPFQSVLSSTVIVFSRPVFDKYGSFRGVIIVTLDPDFFAPLLSAFNSTPDMRAVIAHGDGKIFLLVPERAGVQMTNMDTPGSLFRKHKTSGATTSILRGMIEGAGENGLWAITTVWPSVIDASAPLVLVVGRNTSAIISGWRRDSVLLGISYLLIVIASCSMLHLHLKRKVKLEQELQEYAQELEDKARFVQSVTDGVPGMIGYWDADLHCKFANQAYQDWFGKTPEELAGISVQELLGEELFRQSEAHIYAALWGEPQTFERTLTKPDGTIGYTLARYIPDKQGEKVKGFFALMSDVTEMKLTQDKMAALIETLNTQAVTDGLTGLTNRRHFWELATVELKRSKRHGFQLCLIMLDIDKFKSINDSLGHAAGDEVLRSLSTLMKHALRESDIVGRLGGEEFGILLPQTGEDEAQVIAERLRLAVMDKPVTFEDRTIRYTISIGLAPAWKSEASVDDLVKRADTALYRAKETGRNKVCIAEENG